MVESHLLDWPTICWLEARRVPREVLKAMALVHIVRGYRAPDGWFEPEPRGFAWLAFFEEADDDLVLWRVDTGELTTWRGRAFALGEDNITNASSYQFDTHLHVFGDPLEWLRDGGRGIVVVDWSRAFDRLRDAPRVAVDERLLPTYRDAMKPRHVPELAVIASDVRLAA